MQQMLAKQSMAKNGKILMHITVIFQLNKSRLMFLCLFILSSPLLQAKHSTTSNKQIYWVGHSLITAIDPYYADNKPLPDVLAALSNSQGHSIYSTIHAQGGAPLQANWGQAEAIWPNGFVQLPPLVDPQHPKFGTYNAIVLTEGVALHFTMKHWNSAFYARRFYCAALKANPATQLYLYESWHHFQASDNEFRRSYGSIKRWNFQQYNSKASLKWTQLSLDAAKAGRAKTPSDYKWPSAGPDPGECDQALKIKLIPVGPTLVALLDRIKQPKDHDDLRYHSGVNGSHLVAEDLFANPYLDFPHNTSLHHEGEADDIHPSHILVYLSAVVHYAVLFESSPMHLPAINGVPAGIAQVIQDVAWQIVINDSRTGISDGVKSAYSSPSKRPASSKRGTVQVLKNLP